MNKSKIINLLKRKGFEQFVIQRRQNSEQKIKYENNNFDVNTQAFNDEWIISTFKNGNKITKNIARPSDDDIKEIIEQINQENKYKTKEIDQAPLNKPSRDYENPKRSFFQPLALKTAKNIIKNLARKINASNDKIIDKNTMTFYEIDTDKNTFSSSTGINIESSSADRFVISAYAYAKGEDGGKASAHISFIYKNEQEIDLNKIVSTINQDLSRQLTKQKIATKNYEVVFDHGLFISLFSQFLLHIEARGVIDKISRWKDALNTQITSTKLTYSDRPIFDELGTYITYDEDGFPTRNQSFIKNGKLQKFITNEKLSRLLNVENTGNDVNGNAKVFLGVVEPGQSDEATIISSTIDGILIREFSGMHSGINQISGDFSLEIKGNIIQNGKIGNAIEGGVISGNFFQDILPNIEHVGNKLKIKNFKLSPIIKISKTLPIAT